MTKVAYIYCVQCGQLREHDAKREQHPDDTNRSTTATVEVEVAADHWQYKLDSYNVFLRNITKVLVVHHIFNKAEVLSLANFCFEVHDRTNVTVECLKGYRNFVDSVSEFVREKLLAQELYRIFRPAVDQAAGVP